MAIYRNNIKKCEKCNKIFDYEYYSFVRMPKDNNIKGDVLNVLNVVIEILTHLHYYMLTMKKRLL